MFCVDNAVEFEEAFFISDQFGVIICHLVIFYHKVCLFDKVRILKVFRIFFGFIVFEKDLNFLAFSLLHEFGH